MPYLPALPPAEDLAELPAIERNVSPERWAEAVEAAKEYILEGDIFQVVLSQRFDLVDAIDPLSVYRVLRLVNPSPYMYFLHHPEATVVGSSPEALVQVRDKRVVGRPIAGTRRRGRTEEHDRRMAAELVEHPKERAEHVMLVDLARNDIGRVVRFGTERVEELMTLERYSHVMHMTSQVAGELADDKTPIDVLARHVPGGNGQRRAQGAGDGDHRRARTDQAGAVRRGRRLRRLLRQSRHRDRDPDDVLAQWQGHAAGRSGHRRRFGAQRRRPGMPEQGVGVAHRSSRRAEIVRAVMTNAQHPFLAPVDRDLVVVAGPDATSFLQSLVSQDLDAVAVGGSTHSLLLQPQGKLVVDFYAHRAAADEWWCVCEGGFGETLAAGLKRFKIRVKVDIELRPTRAVALRDADVPLPTGGVTAIPVEWDGRAAYDILGSADALTALTAQLGVPEVGADDYEEARIEAGVPRLGADVDERTIPQEAGLERTAVSFTKGCFLGQELVCRIDTRGHVNRNLRRLRFPASLPVAVEPGGEVTVDGRAVGTITSRAGSVALAMLRREVEPGTDVDVAGAAAPARVEQLSARSG